MSVILLRPSSSAHSDVRVRNLPSHDQTLKQQQRGGARNTCDHFKQQEWDSVNADRDLAKRTMLLVAAKFPLHQDNPHLLRTTGTKL